MATLEKGVKYVQSKKRPQRPHLRRSGVFIVNFEHISYLFLVYLLLTFKKSIFSPQFYFLQSLIIWDHEKALCVIHNAHQDAITSCCWSDVGNYVITGSNDATLKLWDTKFLIANIQNREKLKEKHQFVGHNTSVIDLKYRVSNYLLGLSKNSSYNLFTPCKKSLTKLCVLSVLTLKTSLDETYVARRTNFCQYNTVV